MSRPSRRVALTTAAAILIAGGALGTAGLLVGRTPVHAPADAAPTPAWTEATWPFPLDPWGRGKAYRCRADRCGAEVVVYLRAKLGLCGCMTTIDDDDVDRLSDIDLIASARTALGPGRAIDVHAMKGRGRSYALGNAGPTARSALAMAFHERCDLIVATAAMNAERPARQEQAVVDFLRSDVVLRWAEATLGL
ncbi:hypothetical protein VQ02_15215 [Methylobacterium variabile]|jgi:hypothetical protein|uniref:Uncharacterized protein n=1 Tax=Methylobacterium variabile TaxID=298794 RepID=A0A0J6SMV7_9HYPH|nr:hypothetical protein [Methylobacterium variabile]KMO36530.1 hypothetical protein VQ02_15215 [Methylobacterium variabile]